MTVWYSELNNELNDCLVQTELNSELNDCQVQTQLNSKLNDCLVQTELNNGINWLCSLQWSSEILRTIEIAVVRSFSHESNHAHVTLNKTTNMLYFAFQKCQMLIVQDRAMNTQLYC